ncbi:MAG: FapA family protein, partial [Candidatus Izemoplasmatales bacterium]|nr:FapA family protein [Candidatus Izemoplasmatales bacterium]
MRVLVVDDAPFMRNLLCIMLRNLGTCTQAADGKEAFELYKKAFQEKKPFELIFLDIAMPEMNGKETLAAIRQFEHENEVTEDKKSKILMITAFSNETHLYKSVKDCQGCILKPLTKEKLREKLTLLGIPPELTDPHKPENKQEAPPQHENFVYFEMVPVISELDGRIIFSINKRLENGDTEIVESEVNKIDFLKNVIAGQILARIHGSVKKLRCGDGVTLNHEKGLLYAARSGCVIFEDDTVSILEKLVINEDVKYRNIEFLGAVEINGDVKDGVHISAPHGIKINGRSEACCLNSESDIETGLIMGRGKSVVTCGGTFKAKSIYNTLVEARGDIKIENEAVECILKTSSSIHAGIITGGDATALKTIEVKRAGSPSDSTTILRAGYDFYRIDRREFLEKTICDIVDKIEKIDNMLGPEPENIEKGKSPERREQIRSYIAERKQFAGALAEYEAELAELQPSEKKDSKSEVIINDVLYAGVKVIIHEFEELASD